MSRFNPAPPQLPDVAITNYAKYKSGIDWKPAITQAITDLSAAGGGTLYFPSGTYYNTGDIQMVSNVRLRGAGIGNTLLQLISGSNKDMIVFKGLTQSIKYSGITDMTLDGNKSSNTSGTGIMIDCTGIPTVDAGVYGFIIERLYIRSFANNGVSSIYPIWQYVLRHVEIAFCNGHGMYVTSSDNSYESINIWNCKGNGIYDLGANNRYSNIKSIFSGNGSSDYLNTAGFYFENAKRHTLTNVEAQENFGHGFVFKNCFNINVNGAVSDANGYQSIAVPATPVAGDGIQILTSTNLTIRNFQSTNFKPQKTQDRPVYIDGASSDIMIDYQTDNNCYRDSQIIANLNVSVRLSKDDLTNKFKYDSVTLNNVIQNGDFAGGTTNWLFVGSPTNSIAGNVLTFTPSAINTRASQNVTLTSGRSYFISAKVTVASGNTSSYFVVLKNSSPYPTWGKVTVAGTGAWETLSNFFTMTDVTGTYELCLTDGRSSGWNAIQIKEFFIADITDIITNTSFVAGSINAAKVLDTIISNNGGWFQGIKKFGLDNRVTTLELSKPTQSATATAIASNGTITTSGVTVARVSPTVAVTGIILQAGTFGGQEVTVINEAASANSITFATSVTSFVSDGTSDVISGVSARKFVWDSGTNLWYRIS